MFNSLKRGPFSWLDHPQQFPFLGPRFVPCLSQLRPHLTLEFLKEWVIGFSKADTPLKTASLHYVGPWLANLDQFSRPTRGDAEESVKQVRGIVRSLVSITVAERRVSS